MSVAGYFKRDRELRLLERHYAGLRFNAVEFFGYEDFESKDDALVFVSVSGTAVDLGRHGFMSPSAVLQIPKSGVRSYRDERESRVSIFRTKHRYRVERHIGLEMIAAALVPYLWKPKLRASL